METSASGPRRDVARAGDRRAYGREQRGIGGRIDEAGGEIEILEASRVAMDRDAVITDDHERIGAHRARAPRQLEALARLHGDAFADERERDRRRARAGWTRHAAQPRGAGVEQIGGREHGIEELDLGGRGGRRGGPRFADGITRERERLLDDRVGIAVERAEVEARGAAAGRRIVVDDQRPARALFAARAAGRGLVGRGELLFALDDHPVGDRVPLERTHERAAIDHVGLRRARTRPAPRTHGVSSERHRG